MGGFCGINIFFIIVVPTCTRCVVCVHVDGYVRVLVSQFRNEDLGCLRLQQARHVLRGLEGVGGGWRGWEEVEEGLMERCSIGGVVWGKMFQRVV